MLNRSAEYALSVVTQLALLGPDESAQAAELAATLKLPANYLSKILHQLAAEGILASRRGRSGGFRLALPAERITLEKVVAPFDDIASYRRCVMGSKVCSDRTACVAHARWKPISESVMAFLKETTVAELLDAPTRSAAKR